MKYRKMISRNLLHALIVGYIAIYLGGCVATPTGESSDVELEDAIMIVINDPRSERVRRGASGPGYLARLPYEDDPILRRAAADVANDYDLRILDQWPLRHLDVHCFVVMRPSPSLLRKIEADPRVRWVQPFNHFATQQSADHADIGLNPATHANANASQDGRERLTRFAQEVPQRGEGVSIVVIDTSVDNTHPDLKLSRLRESNFAGRRGRPMSEEHGTAVVGLIAAQSKNPSGVSALAHQAEVNVLRACWQAKGAAGRCNTLTLALALDAAIDLQPDIVNLSLTGQYDRVLQELLEVLLASGTLVVAAYDDDRSPEARFPAAAEGVVYAFGHSPSQTPDPINMRNVLAAPRHAVSITPSAGYDLVSGHSIAAPQIAALAACLIDRHPQADREEIQAHLVKWLAGS